MIRSRRGLSPFANRRLAVGILACGAVVAGTGSALHAGGGSNATYLFILAGFAIAVTGAVLEARAAGVLVGAFPAQVKRRAIAFVATGLLAALGGCVLASTVAGNDAAPISAGGAMALLVAGVGLVLAGLFTLTWSFGVDYAGRRIEQLDDEDW